jgi:hypothetical protein
MTNEEWAREIVNEFLIKPEIEAHDKARLSCRKSGGSYKYFRTQGYVCILHDTEGKPE